MEMCDLVYMEYVLHLLTRYGSVFAAAFPGLRYVSYRCQVVFVTLWLLTVICHPFALVGRTNRPLAGVNSVMLHTTDFGDKIYRCV